MPATYEAIATFTLGSASTFDFTSIPSTYTDLVVIVNGKKSNALCGLRLNNDTGSNYSNINIYAQTSGGAIGPDKNTNTTSFYSGFVNTDYSVNIWNIFNYANTTTYKGIHCKGGNDTQIGLDVGTWRSTAAVNRVTISVLAGDGTFDTGSTATIYGIKAA
jgi:hypothetical protein